MPQAGLALTSNATAMFPIVRVSLHGHSTECDEDHESDVFCMLSPQVTEGGSEACACVRGAFWRHLLTPIPQRLS